MITAFIAGAVCMYVPCWLYMRKLGKALALANQQRKSLAVAAQQASEVLGKMTTALQDNIDQRKATTAEERLKISLLGFNSPSIN
jgi:hypothetical protein